MPSVRALEAARSHFEGGPVPQVEQARVHQELVAANVLLQHIRSSVPYDENDVEFHDLAQIHNAVRAAQEYTR